MILQGSETDWHMQVSWMSSDRWRSSSIPIRTLVLIDLQLMGQSKDGQSTFNTFAWCSGHLISGCLVHILYYTVRIYHISQYITCSFECKLWFSQRLRPSNSVQEDHDNYENVEPRPWCWVSPGTHPQPSRWGEGSNNSGPVMKRWLFEWA